MSLLNVTFLLLHLLVPNATFAAEETTFAGRVLDLTNVERQRVGLAPLSMNPQLNDAAQSYSQVLASSGCFDHTCGSVPNVMDRVRQAGYTSWNTLAENIAAGYQTPEDVVASWMASPHHRANMLSDGFTDLGIGLAKSSGNLGTYWAEEFGSRQGGAAWDSGGGG